MSTATAKDFAFTTAAGPIQTKKVTTAVHALPWRGRTRVELRGVIGGEERRAELTQPFSAPSDEATAALTAIGEQFTWSITRENYAEIVTALELATRKLVLPIDDCRETADEEAQRTANRAKQDQDRAAEREVNEAAYKAILAKRPAGAEALILAIYDEDDSDSMSDYHNHKIIRVVAIGWRRGTREDFRQLRTAAATFPETAHLGPDADESVEHRENWSMGSGNYVKAGGDDSTGWRVKSQPLYAWTHPVVMEDRLTTTAAIAAPETSAAPSSGYIVEKHYHTKRAFDMWLVILADRVDRLEFERLRSSCEDAGGWYSRAWGKTPGGFAFKSPEAANAWAASGVGNTSPAATATAEPSTLPTAAAGSNPTAARLRGLADGMTAGIENQRRPMTQNPTPKRMREYYGRVIDGDNAERCQRALYALADAHDAGTVPPILASLKSKSQIGPMVAYGTASNGYYDVHSTGEYRDKSPAAVALQQLMEGSKTAADREADASRQKTQSLQTMIEALRFVPIPGFFPTPRAVIDDMVQRAELLPTHTVLEPSAGKGDIADAIMEHVPNIVSLVCIEIVPRLVEVLCAKGYIVDGSEGGDFLKGTPIRGYDRILMNPPFEGGQDAEHIRHAFECLAPGVRLLAICSAGPFFRSDRKSQEFREWIQDVCAEVEDIAADSFNGTDAFRRTGVSCKMVVINK